MIKKVLLLVLVLSVFPIKAKAQGTAGKDFWVGFMAHSWDCYTSSSWWNNDTPLLFLSSQVAATVKIEAPGQGYSKTITLVPNVTTELMLPRTVVCRYSDTVTTNGVHVSSSETINVYAVNRFWYSKGATVVIPTESIVNSPEYVVTTDEDSYNWGWYCNGKNFRSAEFVIVGVADSSVIEIVPTGASTRYSTPNVPFQITLKKGEAFQYLTTDNDLTGSIIRSKYPLSKYSVFAGNRLTYRYMKDKNGNQCFSSWDHTYEQMLPTVTWGNKYTAMPFKNNPGGYYLKVVAAENNTKVYINGNYHQTLRQAGYFEYMLFSDTVTTITSTNRISVAQFTKGYHCAKNPVNMYNGDPSQMQLFPDEQYGNNATVNTVSSNLWWWWNWWWWKPENYINIMVKNGDTADFTLNNSKIANSQWKTFGTPARHYAQVKIDSGSHYMQSNKGFLAYVYGYSFVEGYAYAAAARFKPIQNNFIITNAQCKKDTVKFTAIPNDSFANFTWKFGDGATASGPNVKHKYADTGWYSVKMYCRHIITNVLDSVSKDLYVADTKIKSLFNKDTAICGPVNMIVISKGFNIDNTYKWNDGHDVYYRAVKNPGILWLEVTERNGCTFRDTLKVTNSGIPKANFSVSNDTFCLNRSKNVAFKNLSTSKDTIVEYNWDFGEKTLKSMDSVLSYQFKQANTYAVMLRATTKYGCFHDTFQIVDVLPSPKADFSFTKKDTCFNTNGILLKNNTVPNIADHKRYKWYFSEGYVISNNNPSTVRTYSAPGDYQVMLIYENNNKCIDTMVKSLKIYTNPKAGFKIASGSLCTLDTIRFSSTTTSDYKPLNYEWNWGDGSANTFTSDTFSKHAYLDYDTFSTNLVAISPQGCTDTFRRYMLLDESPIVDFTINKDTQCLNAQSFTFTNLSILQTGTMSFKWTLGNGSTSTDSNIVNYRYVNDSVYNVKLTATSPVGCKAEKTKQVSVGGYPNTGFTINNAKQCFRNNSFTFTNTSTITQGSILSYKWNFGNGGSGTQQNVNNYNYSSEDTFNVQLVANSNFGCQDTINQTVITFAQPKSLFNVNNPTQCFNGHEYKYTNTSSIKYGNISYNWNMGDNTVSTDTNVTKTYAVNNTYSVRLIVTSANGCKDTFSKSVLLNASPKAKFTINNAKQCFRNNAFSFINNSSISLGNIASSNWVMGNTVTSNNNSVFNFNYTTEDTFKVQLIVNSDAGCADTTVASAITFAQPKALFFINSPVQCFNQQHFVYTNQSTLKRGQLNFNWVIGDGAVSTDTNIIKKYLKDSVYNVRLIASSENNCHDTIIKTVTLYTSPASDFIIPSDKQCFRGNSFNFGNRSSIRKGTIIQYMWDMDDGNVSYNYSVFAHKYMTEDTFNVKLISLSDKGCYDTATKMAITWAQPVAKFVIPKDTQCWHKNYFNFNNQTALKYGKLFSSWKFGDNTTSTDYNPVTKKYPNTSATYQIKYNAISDHGCKDSFWRQIVLLERPVSEFTINDSIQCFKGHLFSFVNKTTFSVPSTLTYWWNYGNGDSNVGITPKTAVYNNPGLYNVSLVSNSSITNCYDTLIKVVIPAPHANVAFTVNKDTQCLRFNDFRFTNLSTVQFGDMVYNWSFKDNSSDTARNPSKQYASENIYNVKLVVTTNYDCKDSIEKPVQFYVTPVAKFIINDDVQCLNNQLFNFTNNSTIKSGTFSQDWVFDDNTSHTTFDVLNKTFTKTDDIKFYLSVLSDNGCTDTVNGKVYVEKSKNSLITLDENDSQCLSGNVYQFKVLNVNPKVTITSYSWKYGDGQTGTSPVPAPQTFNKDGIFLVELNTVSANGCLDTVYRPVVVHPQPSSSFTADTVCFPEPVRFINTSTVNTGTIVSNTWYFGDGARVFNVIDPVRYYKAAGEYDVSLVTVSNYGCMDSIGIQKGAVVKLKPRAGFEFDRLPTIVNDETRLQFNNRASADADQFYWDFGNTTYSTSENPIGIYPDTGRYQVTQIVFNGLGCSDTITKPTGLLLPDFFYYLPNSFTPNNNGLNEVFRGVGSQYFYKFTMEIFNRWGEKIFESNDIHKGWDGTYEGEPCMEGMYLCRVYIIPLYGAKRSMEQMVTLLR